MKIKKQKNNNMINDNKLSSLADVIIDIVMKLKKQENNGMGLMMALEGDGQFLVEARPGAGHDFKYILDAVYRYHKKHPEDRIDIYLYETFIKFSKVSVLPYKVNESLNIFLKQVENQKKGISPFTIDMISVLNELRKTIYEENLNNDSEYMSVVNRFDKYFQSYLGCKVL